VEVATLNKEKPEESVCSPMLKVFYSTKVPNPDFSHIVLVKPLFQAW